MKDIVEAKKQVIEAGHRLVEAGLIARTWGNISARISDSQFVITPSGRGYDDLTVDDIVVVNIADCAWDGSVKPSSEKGVHAAGYRQRPDVDFIVHTHQLAATAVGTLGETVSEDNVSIPCGKYAISSTKPLAKNMEMVFAAHKDADIFFMRYHGLVVLGKDMEDCFAKANQAEEICQKRIDKIVTGGLTCDPEVTLPQSLVDAIGKKSVVLSNQMYTRKVSAKGQKIRPMIDDLAQIGGVDIPCVASVSDKNAIVKHLKKRGAVLVSGVGAICAADSMEDAEAIAIILEKNCLAQCYCEAQEKKYHLGYWDALFQRNVYLKKYSKLK